MDITFEEVAHVIQDARYQQAIFDSDIPKPDKKIPGPTRGFSVQQFVEQNNVNLSTVLAEPLGRYFLRSFIDPTTNNAEARLLDFTDAIFELRRRDPLGIVHATDILALVERFNLKLPVGPGKTFQALNKKSSSQNSSSDGTPGKSLTRGTSKGGGESTSTSIRSNVEDISVHNKENEDDNEVVVAINVNDDAQNEEGAEEEEDDDDDDNNNIIEIKHVESPPQVLPKKIAVVEVDNSPLRKMTSANSVADDPPSQAGGNEGSKVYKSAWTETNVTRYDDKEREDMTNPGHLSTFAANYSTSVNTYGAAAAAAVSRAAAKHIQHSQRSFDLNANVQSLMENGLKDVYARFFNDKRSFTYYCKLKWYSLQPVGDKQIRYHRVLGTGAFGTVNGCIVASLGRMLAMKTMMKKKIKAKRAKSQVVAERQALEALAAHPSPYTMRLRYAYQTKEAFHLILPLAIGGDLKFHLKDGPFEPERAKVYAAEVALGLGHIHSLGLIIRDLKPRNILLNSKGHAQISDLGLAVNVSDGRTIRGRAGTEGYWAPEVINNLHYSYDADWWSYGCCVYEFNAGFNPFSCKHTGLKARNEGTRKAKVKFTKKFPESCKPLVLSLLNRDVKQRLGCQGKGVQEVLSDRHAYWEGLDMDAIRRNELPPPWVPEKGVIYALGQSEIQDHDEDLELRKIKLDESDQIEFEPFIDRLAHQEDIVKVLESSLGNNRQSMGPIPNQGEDVASCCCVLS